jgi:hypothetical protein
LGLKWLQKTRVELSRSIVAICPFKKWTPAKFGTVIKVPNWGMLGGFGYFGTPILDPKYRPQFWTQNFLWTPAKLKMDSAAGYFSKNIKNISKNSINFSKYGHSSLRSLP